MIFEGLKLKPPQNWERDETEECLEEQISIFDFQLDREAERYKML